MYVYILIVIYYVRMSEINLYWNNDTDVRCVEIVTLKKLY